MSSVGGTLPNMSNNSIQRGDSRPVDRGRDPRVGLSASPRSPDASVFLRSLGAQPGQLGFDHLGMSYGTRALLQHALARRQGIVLVAGPPGSGRTTTIYAIVEHIRSICDTINAHEDPPRVVFVPEIHDSSTADMAAHGTLAGDLIVSSIQASTATRAIRQLILLGMPLAFLATHVQAIVTQRLVRMACRSCREEVAIRNALFDSMLPLTEWIGSGCTRCGGTGYRGRTAIFEVHRMDPSLQRSLDCDASGYAIEVPTSRALSLAGASLYEDGLRQVQAGSTTLEEVLRVTSA